LAQKLVKDPKLMQAVISEIIRLQQQSQETESNAPQPFSMLD
jgi:hypothetical protein